MVALESIPLFQSLTDREWQILRPAAEERRYPAGHDIFKEGDTGDGVYFVKEGQVQVSGIIGDNARHVFSRFDPGDFFGEMAVIEAKPRSACAQAATDAVVYFIPRAVMLQLVEQSPRLSGQLVREISARLREFNQQYVREVLQAERLSVVGRFARTIIHDLKNPLNIIGLSAELGGLASASAEQRRTAYAGIRKQVERINDMVNEILEFTQGAPGVFQLESTDYALFVRMVVDELRAEADLQAITLELVNPPPAVKVRVQPKRLTHLFHNLIHNAGQAMPKGGKVMLRFAVSPTEITTEIQDTGPGIAPEIAARLFEPFATFGKAHGTGLGLSICKKIVEDHQGHITARNHPGGGAVFAFTLPLAQAGVAG
ncbi:MAG TPA: ATP-binding protein [Dongiaceae bacterium]|nr:ATP-binding protein [Dongiaceae bacterium]